MYVDILDNLPMFICGAALCYAFQYVAIKKMVITKFLDIFLFTNITISLSISYLYLLYVVGKISFFVFFGFFFQYVLFFLSISLSLFIVFNNYRRKSLITNKGLLSLTKSVDTSQNRMMLYVMFGVFIVVKIYMNYRLFVDYGSGDERLLLAKSSRGLSLFSESLANLVGLSLLFFFAITKKIKFFLMILLYCTVSFFGGSKGPIIMMILMYIMVLSILGRTLRYIGLIGQDYPFW